MPIPKNQELISNYNQKAMEQEWAKYKYWVMSKSHRAYNRIRQSFKNNPRIDVADFYRQIEELEKKEYSVKDEINALQHCWGYFKKIANDQEKKEFLEDIAQLKSEKIQVSIIRHRLYQLAEKYEVQYLLDCYYLKKILQ